MKTRLAALIVVLGLGAAAQASDAFVQSPTFTATQVVPVFVAPTVMAPAPVMTFQSPVVVSPTPVTTFCAPQPVFVTPVQTMWGRTPVMSGSVFYPGQPVRSYFPVIVP